VFKTMKDLKLEYDHDESDYKNIKYGYGELNKLNQESLMFKLNPDKVTAARFKRLINRTGRLD
tara:strand:- start:79 stop:267 length:189 start_codon:yes stop_codon:yes gene_type:complete